MKSCVRCVATVLLIVAAGGGAAAQGAPAEGDSRTQFPAFLANSYFSVNIGFIDYPFSQRQLQAGFRAESVTVPHVAARVALFGHQFNKYVAVQGTYMRPVQYVSYRSVNGADGAHHVWMHFGGVTLISRAPLTRRLSAYGEGGLGITSRSGFERGAEPVVRDAHYAAPLAGGGVEYHVTPAWDLIGGALYSPGRSREAQPRTILLSGGFRYTMRPLPPERVEANRRAGFVFPANVVQLEWSTGYGYGINTFVSRKVPIFWGGNVKVDRGVAVHYDRNVFHSRKVFALDFGTSASYWRSRANQDTFYTLSAYPLLRFTFLRTGVADFSAVYSLAGPTYISQSLIDGRDTGNHFTFQDFMGLGVLARRTRNVSLTVKINHYSNGNIFTENAGLKIPVTFGIGYAF